MRPVGADDLVHFVFVVRGVAPCALAHDAGRETIGAGDQILGFVFAALVDGEATHVLDRAEQEIEEIQGVAGAFEKYSAAAQFRVRAPAKAGRIRRRIE